jgi:hypothetical protein
MWGSQNVVAMEKFRSASSRVTPPFPGSWEFAAKRKNGDTLMV